MAIGWCALDSIVCSCGACTLTNGMRPPLFLGKPFSPSGVTTTTTPPRLHLAHNSPQCGRLQRYAATHSFSRRAHHCHFFHRRSPLGGRLERRRRRSGRLARALATVRRAKASVVASTCTRPMWVCVASARATLSRAPACLTAAPRDGYARRSQTLRSVTRRTQPPMRVPATARWCTCSACSTNHAWGCVGA